MNNFTELLNSWGPAGILLLAAIDSAGIPLPAAVDFLVVAIAAANADRAWSTAFFSVIGSVIGCMILFSLARKGGEIYLDRRTVSPRTRQFRAWFGRYGLLTVFIPALVPIIPLPVKVFVLSAGALGVRPRSFLFTCLAARIPRYFCLAYIGFLLGADAWPWLKGHAWQLGVFAFCLLIALALFLRFAAGAVAVDVADLPDTRA